MVFAQAADTVRLAEYLRAVRGQQQLTSAQAKRVRADLLAWTDTRLRQGRNVPQMNDELEANGLFPPASLAETEDIYAGYLDRIVQDTIPWAPDLVRIDLAVGMTCGFDQTSVIYRKDRMERIGWINEVETNGSLAWGVAPIVAGPPDAAGKRILAAGLMHRWCTSAWGSIELRIWEMDNEQMRPLLIRGLGARRDEDITATVEGEVVTFRYSTSAPDVTILVRPAIHRYRIQGNRATRIPPFAETLIGFVDEWVDLEGDLLRQTSSSEARRAHAEAMKWIKDSAGELFESSRCAGTPSLWQVGFKAFNGPEVRYFLINENGPANLQMVGFTSQPVRECPAVDVPELTGPLQFH